MQLVYFWLFFNVMTNLPAIFCPAKALALGYVSAEKMPTDKGATMTLEFYMGFQMMNFQLTVGALILFIIFADTIAPVALFILLWCLFSIGIFFYGIVFCEHYGFNVLAMLATMTLNVFVAGGSFVALLDVYN